MPNFASMKFSMKCHPSRQSTTNFTRFWILWAPTPTFLHWWGKHLAPETETLQCAHPCQILPWFVHCVTPQQSETTNFEFMGFPYSPPFTVQGEIWHVTGSQWCAISCQISAWSVFTLIHWSSWNMASHRPYTSTVYSTWVTSYIPTCTFGQLVQWSCSLTTISAFEESFHCVVDLHTMTFRNASVRTPLCSVLALHASNHYQPSTIIACSTKVTVILNKQETTRN